MKTAGLWNTNLDINADGGWNMKRYLIIMCVMALILMTGTAFAEEAGCFQSTDNWIIRVYSGGTASPYSFTLAVVDPATGLFVPHSSIKAFAGATAPCLNADRAATNLCQIETGAQSPD